MKIVRFRKQTTRMGQIFILFCLLALCSHPIPVAQAQAENNMHLDLGTNIVVNGSFETPTVQRSTFDTYRAGQTFGGWTVESGTIDHIAKNYWQASDGFQSVDLTGSPGNATIYQDLATIPHQTYQLSFDLSGNPEGSPAIKQMEVWWGETYLDTVIYDVTGNSNWNMNWSNRTYFVAAEAARTRLTFKSLTSGSYGPVVDNIKVESYSEVGPPLVTSFSGQGFDKCEIATLDQLQTWITRSPYRVVNLYIGGLRRSCANSALTSSYVQQLGDQGWKFIPTWVGPQCLYNDIDSDLTIAYNQGVHEADAAITAAANLGLTWPDSSGTIIYYDLEGYTGSNPNCREPAKSFIAGWTAQLHARGNLSGVYGSSCASHIADFATISDPPDAVWPAGGGFWSSQYDLNATVWGNNCVPNGLWPNHQRIYQYTSGHPETWGGVSLTIDSNVIDGMVAFPYRESWNTDLFIGGTKQRSYYVPLHQSLRDRLPGLSSGPVKIINTDNNLTIASERVIYKVNGVDTSFSEMMALPHGQLNTVYWLPWYNNVDLDTQLRLGNVSDSTATINVSIANMTATPIILAPGDSTRVSFPGVNNGPVSIVSNVGIVAAERVIYKVNGVPTSFSEMMGLPHSQLDTTYWLPWYNNVELDTQLRIANVSNAIATVQVYIGGQQLAGGQFTLAPGASTRKSFPGVNNGPVKISSNRYIVVAERVIYKVNDIPTSYSEMMALPNGQLDSAYWLPWYNNSGELDTQLRIANVGTATTNVHVFIGGLEITGSPFTLAAGASTRKHFANINTGPVQIVSNQNLVAAERVIYKANGVYTSFSEMMGLPGKLLDRTYWLPWYNNVDLDTQLRFGVP